MKQTILKIGIRLAIFWLFIAASTYVISSLFTIKAFTHLKQLQFDRIESDLYKAKLGLKLHRFTLLKISEDSSNQLIDINTLVNQTLEKASMLGLTTTDAAINSFSGNDIPQEKLDTIIKTSTELLSLANTINKEYLTNPATIRLKKVYPNAQILADTLNSIDLNRSEIQSLIESLPELLGYNSATQYIVLLQNNMELRPTGGFMGSFARIKLEQGAIKELEIQDIYEPDGKVTGYVKEPDPISKYLFRDQTPGWRLRDSNWNPDFPTAVTAIDWFFNEGRISDIDGYIGINLHLINNLIARIQPLILTDYQVSLTAENFYQLAQTQAEHDFFPGSTQKRDFLSSVAKTLLIEMQLNPTKIMPHLPAVISQGFVEKQVIFHHLNPTIAPILANLHLNGQINDITCLNQDCNQDYLHLNEANLGINKANCCIDRYISDTIKINPRGNPTHHLEIIYINNNPSTPKPPVTWGGGYTNYLRLYVPKNTTLTTASINGISILTSVDNSQEGDKEVFGLLVSVKGQSQATVTLEYTLDNTVNLEKPYEYVIQKQSGIINLPFKLTFITPTNLLNTETVPPAITDNGFTNITRDTTFIRSFTPQ